MSQEACMIFAAWVFVIAVGVIISWHLKGCFYHLVTGRPWVCTMCGKETKSVHHLCILYSNEYTAVRYAFNPPLPSLYEHVGGDRHRGVLDAMNAPDLCDTCYRVALFAPDRLMMGRFLGVDPRTVSFGGPADKNA